MNARGELARLLDPLSPAEFFEKHWERKPVHLPGSPAKLAGLHFDTKAFWNAVDELPDDATCLRAIYYDSAGKHQELLEVAPKLARSLFESGMTLVFAFLEDHSDEIRRYVRLLRDELELPGHVTVGCFFSPKDHGAGLHYDSHSALVLQLEGRKRWQVSREPALEFPPKNYGFESDEALLERNAKSPGLETKLPVLEQFLEVELEPGDVLYMPPGTWHRPRSMGAEGSFALTFGPFVKNPLQLVSEQLARGLGARLEWRRSVPVAPASPAPVVGLPGQVERFFAERLAELRSYVSELEPADLARLWHAQVAAPPALSLERLRVESSRDVSPQDQVFVDRARRTSTLRAPDDAGEDKLFLYVDGDEIDLPPTAAPFVETLLARESFVASEAQQWVAAGDEPFDWDDVKTILEVLVSRGLLHRGASA